MFCGLKTSSRPVLELGQIEEFLSLCHCPKKISTGSFFHSSPSFGSCKLPSDHKSLDQGSGSGSQAAIQVQLRGPMRSVGSGILHGGWENSPANPIRSCLLGEFYMCFSPSRGEEKQERFSHGCNVGMKVTQTWVSNPAGTSLPCTNYMTLDMLCTLSVSQFAYT